MFKIGDKVKCIKDDSTVIIIKKDYIYTITDVFYDDEFNIYCYYVNNSVNYFDEYEFKILFEIKI